MHGCQTVQETGTGTSCRQFVVGLPNEADIPKHGAVVANVTSVSQVVLGSTDHVNSQLAA